MSDVGDVLVVDDDIPIAIMIAECLMDEGYAVRVVHTAGRAIEEIQSQPPDLIILDLMLPGMRGDQLLQYLRTHGFADLPIIIISAAHDFRLFSLSGATAQLAKPFQIQDLLRCVDRYRRRA